MQEEDLIPLTALSKMRQTVTLIQITDFFGFDTCCKKNQDNVSTKPKCFSDILMWKGYIHIHYTF